MRILIWQSSVTAKNKLIPRMQDTWESLWDEAICVILIQFSCNSFLVKIVHLPSPTKLCRSTALFNANVNSISVSIKTNGGADYK